MNTSEVLRKAKALIEERGWVKGYYQLNGALCARSAINVAVSGSPHVFSGRGAVNALRGQIPEYGIAHWNDNPDRTKEEVLDAFERAAALAESRGD